MAKFKNQDILLDDNEQVILGSGNDAAIYWDSSDLITTKHPKHITEGYYATKDYVKGVVAGLEWQDSVLSASTDIPGAPNYGDRYIIPSGASGAWSGLDDDIAEYTTTWGYVTPSAGFSAWVEDVGAWYVYSGSNWINFGGKIDHGNLLGLSDDDHTQYFNTVRGDARYYTQAQVTSLTLEASANAADVAMDYTDSEFTTHTGAADPHTGYVLESLADAANDFLVASADNTFVKKTLAETGAILEGDIQHDNLQGITANEHIDWTSTAENLDTSGSVTAGAITGDTFTVGASAGATGWFDDGTNFRVDVAEGIITDIGASVAGGFYMGT